MITSFWDRSNITEGEMRDAEVELLLCVKNKIKKRFPTQKKTRFPKVRRFICNLLTWAFTEKYVAFPDTSSCAHSHYNATAEFL